MVESRDPAMSAGRGRDAVWIVIAAMVSVGALLVCAIPFSEAQSIWSDETTQLAGADLEPGRGDAVADGR